MFIVQNKMLQNKQKKQSTSTVCYHLYISVVLEHFLQCSPSTKGYFFLHYLQRASEQPNMSLNVQWATSVQSTSMRTLLDQQRFWVLNVSFTTSGSERTPCWLQPPCVAHASSWSRCPPSQTPPAAPARVSHTCACVDACCCGILRSSTSWRGSAVGSP